MQERFYSSHRILQRNFFIRKFDYQLYVYYVFEFSKKKKLLIISTAIFRTEIHFIQIRLFIKVPKFLFALERLPVDKWSELL